MPVLPLVDYCGKSTLLLRPPSALQLPRLAYGVALVPADVFIGNHQT